VLSSSWDVRPFGHNRHEPKRGDAVPLSGGERGSHLTQCGLRRSSKAKGHLDPSSRLATTDMGRKLGGCAPSLAGQLGSHPTQCGQGRAYLHAKLHLHACNRLATIYQSYRRTDRTHRTDRTRLIAQGEPFYKRSPQKLQELSSCKDGWLFGHNRHGPKGRGGCCAPFGGEGVLGPHLTQCGLSQGNLHSKWHLDPSSRLAIIDMGQKVGGCCAPFWAGKLGSHLTSAALRPTSIPSGGLIHPAIWPQQTWAKNWRGCAPFGGAGFPPKQCGLLP